MFGPMPILSLPTTPIQRDCRRKGNSHSPNLDVSSFWIGIGMTSLEAFGPSPRRTRVPSGRKRKTVLTGLLDTGSMT